MDDAVARYCTATTANDVDAILATLAPDAELVSPLSEHMVFRGHDDLRVLTTAVYGTIAGLTWGEQIGDGRTVTAIANGRVGRFRLADAMIFELDDSGLIRRIRPHLRPWLATTVFAFLLGPKVARSPRVVLRALRSG